MRVIAVLSCVLIFGISPLLMAEAKAETEISLAAATSIELKLTLAETITLPWLAGEGFLVKDNNIQFKLAAEATPVTLAAWFETTWTPLAFLQLVAGAQLGSGWDIGFAHGLSLNYRSGANDKSLTTVPFAALLWKVKAGAVVQFDLAALLPGDWNHVVFRTYHELYYRALGGVADDISWLYEADQGENRNGWNYYGNYFIGYQMPIFLDMVGFLLETDRFLYSTPGRASWGDDLMRWNFGPVVNFKLDPKLSLTFLVQFWSWRNFSTATESYGFYQDRVLDTANPLSVIFRRAALVLTVKL